MATEGLEKAQRLVWAACQVAELRLSETLVEVAVIVTDNDLNIVAEGPDLVIHQPEEVIESMVDWCKKAFAKNGLTEKIRKSNVSVMDAELMVLDFVRQHTVKGASPLAGNNVDVDRHFLSEYMPDLINHLHYRIIDVSSVKELVKRWRPDLAAFEKQSKHRVLDDIRESIAELNYYRKHVFKETPPLE